ncbi:hypothetical protein EVAR_23493_1 [Eumeta japonica]|uniref:Uncharacterized protein n=1 Tax=Eumeta variegata TaxID=151549 RepID=A0A4C1W2E1_EUMVA|nr:hypothetical protein EVAR_23493_1 [Eumeta japonica]
MDICNLRGVTSVLPASWEGIVYSNGDETDQIDDRGGPGSLTSWTKGNSGSCYFKPVFCESVVEGFEHGSWLSRWSSRDLGLLTTLVQ